MAQTKEGAMKLAAKKLGISLDEYRSRIGNHEKWCTSCRSWKAWDDFAKGLGSYGLGAQCRKCQSEYGKRHHIPIPKHLRKKPGRIPEAERFMQYVKKTDRCWEWQGSTLKGYGQFTTWMNGRWKKIRAHRFSWQINEGPIPTGLLVLHKCDNPKCVNPSHLFLGTYKDNAQDREQKGRGAHSNCTSQPGEKNGSAKLTERDVTEIRELRKQGYQYKQLAKMFGVWTSQIGNIVRGECWK